MGSEFESQEVYQVKNYLCVAEFGLAPRLGRGDARSSRAMETKGFEK